VTIADVRALQERAKDRWSAVVREAICNVLRLKGEFHADDLTDLGVPDHHRNIIGSQIARLVNQGWMVEEGRRKSTVPSRNGAKSNVYRLTKAGVAGVGVGAGRGDAQRRGCSGVAPPSTSADPGEPQPRPTGAPSSQEADRATNPPVQSASDQSSPAAESASQPVAGENLSLLPEPDPKAWAA